MRARSPLVLRVPSETQWDWHAYPATMPRIASSHVQARPGANRQARRWRISPIAAHARLGIKASYPFAEGAPGLVPGVEHVTAAEMTDEQLLALLRQQLHLLNQPLRREIGRHHIVIAMRDQDLHVWVHAHGEAQVIGCARRSPKRMGWLVALPVAIDGKAQELVAALRIDTNLCAKNMIDAAGKGALDAGQSRIRRLVIIAIWKRIDAGDRRIIKTHNLALGFQKLACEAPEGHTAVRKADKLDRQSEKIRSTCKHSGLLVRIVRRADKQGMGKFTGGKGLDFAPLRLDRCARGKYPRAAVEGRCECHCAEAIHRVQHVVIIAVQARPFEHRRDSNRRREADAMRLLQATHEFGRSEAAVAF